MIGPFGAEPKPDAESKSRVKEWFRAYSEIGEETSLMVTELRCAEPGCPPIETAPLSTNPETGSTETRSTEGASRFLNLPVKFHPDSEPSTRATCRTPGWRSTNTKMAEMSTALVAKGSSGNIW